MFSIRLHTFTKVYRKIIVMASELEKLLKLGKNIQEARKAAGFSQNELAERLNISREHLAKLETAKRRISLKLLFKMSDILGVKEKYFLDFKE